MEIYRPQLEKILSDLEKKIVFLVGPRQVGKTWLAKTVIDTFEKNKKKSLYLNYDSFSDRDILLNESWAQDCDLLVFDELHKAENWAQRLKGIYDTKPPHQKILVTGSGRLDILRRTGESLAGRYFIHRILPFSPKELSQNKTQYPLSRYLERGGFPEPFLASDSQDADRWRRMYIDGLLKEDVWTIDTVQNLRKLHLTLELLQKRVGSPISYTSLAEDVAVSPNTIKKYIDIFEALYILFKVTPFSKNIARSILKEPKIYFFDNGLVEGDAGAKLENLVAVCLLKSIWNEVDQLGKRVELNYLRTKDQKEVDFVYVEKSEPKLMIEVKCSDKDLSKTLEMMNKKYMIPAKQLVGNLKHAYVKNNILIEKVETFLEELF